MIPVIFFTTIIIALVRMETYKGTANEFFWFSGSKTLTDFFCIFKTHAIFLTAIVIGVIILYSLFSFDFYIKKSFAYIPMAIYSAFVLLSYIFSDYKQYALMGWNDRFEGTIVLLLYMLVLFYIINTVNSEKNVKWILYPLTAVSFILGLIGVSQYYSHDFFATTIGKKLITPSWFWDQLSVLKFNFEQGQIYQTVFNPNYVSFYTTLIIPIFALLFIQTKSMVQKVVFGLAFAFALFNMIGSVSSGGLVGLFASFILAIVLFNKKLIDWKKPLFVLIGITILVSGLTFNRLLPSLKVSLAFPSVYATATASNTPLHIDFMETKSGRLRIGLDGKVFNFIPTIDGQNISFSVTDDSNKVITAQDPILQQIKITTGRTKNFPSFSLQINNLSWIFVEKNKEIMYYSDLKKLSSLSQPASIGFKNNQTFGSGRGYIWSKTLPLLKNTLLVGHGADTFAIYFPQNDSIGKLNNLYDRNIVVDKAHNMYLGAAVGTGVVSVLALLAMFILYGIQGFKLYRKATYTTYLEYAGAGIFLGVVGFLFAGLINDSSVSTMPMFYGLLGTGIAVNMILEKSDERVDS